MPTDKTTYLPELIFNKTVQTYMNLDTHEISRKTLKDAFIKCGYKPETANKWIKIYVELYHYTDNGAYIHVN